MTYHILDMSYSTCDMCHIHMSAPNLHLVPPDVPTNDAPDEIRIRRMKNKLWLKSECRSRMVSRVSV